MSGAYVVAVIFVAATIVGTIGLMATDERRRPKTALFFAVVLLSPLAGVFALAATNGV